MKLFFYGGASEVTGVKYILEAKAGLKTVKIMVDCGLLQGGRENYEKNYEKFPFDAGEIDYLLITHAHIDHVGLMPKLYKYGFRGNVFMTPPTKDLAFLTLSDSQAILEKDFQKTGKEPFYGKEDIKGIFSLIKTVDYGKKQRLKDKVCFRFNDAGHMLGSSVIEIWAPSTSSGQVKIVFSGDLGNAPSPLLKMPEKIKEADYILIDSVYGDRIHEERDKRREIFENTIEETYSRKGVLMIPAFAVERTQELLCELSELVENCRIPQIPVFIDSPLAIQATEIYKKYPEYFNEEAVRLMKTKEDYFEFPGLKYVEKVEESKAINSISPPKIIFAGSGMSVGGRILFHEKLYLPDPHSCLLITNYQIEGTLGRQLLEGEKAIKIFGEEVTVRARVVSLGGYSAHADQKALYSWLENFSKPVKHIFAVQGEVEASQALVQLVRDHLGVPASVPKFGEVVEL